MNIKDLVPVSKLANLSGVKMLAYGAPGSGKTPIAQTAPRPVILAVEAGMLSMRGVDNIPAYKADTAAKIEDFMKWWFESAEAKGFDTLVMDSISHAANVILAHEKSTTKHGPAAYGQMGEKVYGWAEKIFTQPERHAYLICQQGVTDENGVSKRRPIFPGQDLNTRIPHLFDIIAHVSPANIPGQRGPVTAIRCMGGFDVMARDRSGKLAEYEPPNLQNIFAKVIS